MERLEQGTIIRIQNQSKDALILSKDFFNQTGMVIAAPIFEDGPETVLHIPIRGNSISGFVHLEAMKGLDLRVRYYSIRDKLELDQIQNVSDTVQGIFDYYPY